MSGAFDKSPGGEIQGLGQVFTCTDDRASKAGKGAEEQRCLGYSRGRGINVKKSSGGRVRVLFYSSFIVVLNSRTGL